MFDSPSLPERQVVIEGFTIRSGYRLNGGGVYINGRFRVYLRRCWLVDNEAGPIVPIGSRLSIIGLLDQQCGGAVCCGWGTVTLEICVIEGCRAQKGGAIYGGSGMRIVHSTITGNLAQQGGGLYYKVSKSTQPEVAAAKAVNSIFWDNRADFGDQMALGTNGPIPVSLGSGSVPNDLVPGQPEVLRPEQQGVICPTGQPWDLAIDGPDFFVLDGGGETLYKRIGHFELDSEGYLIDPPSGRTVRRWGTLGEDEGFQTPGDARLLIPLDGYGPGALARTTIDDSGRLICTFSNGVNTVCGQIATAVFLSPHFLEAVDHDCYRPKAVWGPPRIGAPRGTIHSRALEDRLTQWMPEEVPLTLEHCLVQEGLKAVSFDDAHALKAMQWETTNLETNPGFRAAGEWVETDEGPAWQGGDYRLMPDSPCIDRGAYRMDLPAKDLAGFERPFDFSKGRLAVGSPFELPGGVIQFPLSESYFDLGAFEASWQSAEGVVTISPGTIQDDGQGRVLVSIRFQEEPGSAPAGQMKLCTTTGLEPSWLYTFRAGRGNQMYAVALFEYKPFRDSVLRQAMWSSVPPYDIQVPLDFWIDRGHGPYLKVTGQVRYVGRGRVILMEEQLAELIERENVSLLSPAPRLQAAGRIVTDRAR